MVNSVQEGKDPKVKERLLLIIRVRCDQQIPYRVVKEMNRSNPWASDWLKRFDDEGIDGLKNRAKCGRHSELSEETNYKIKIILRESNQGWTTKQIEELIIMESGIKYHYSHIYRVVKKWGLRQKIPSKVQLTLLQKRKRMNSKKDLQDSCGYLHEQKDFHSIFRRIFLLLRFLVRRVWMVRKKDRNKDTGSHDFSCLFGAVSDGPKAVIQTGRT